LTDDIPGVSINGEQCNFCDLHDRLEEKYSDEDPKSFNKVLDKISSHGKNKPYNCLIGISGGCDSSWMVSKAILDWKLNPLVIHFDNQWNGDIAEQNISILQSYLKFDLIRYRRNIDQLNKAFLEASVSDADIPNDIAMLTLFMETAEKYGIKYIFNGHDFRTEGSSPLGWSYMDGKYIKSVWDASIFGRLKNDRNFVSSIRTYPNLTLKKQARWGLKRFIQVRPLYWKVNAVSKADKKAYLKDRFGWQDYGGVHCENKYTEFIGSYLLPKKFGIDKRILYLSAQIRSGDMTKKNAKRLLEGPVGFDEGIIEEIKARLGMSDKDFETIMKQPRKTFKDFETYHNLFVRYKPLFWLAGKLRLFPETFVRKYTQEISFDTKETT